MACGITDTREALGDCDIAFCPAGAAYLVVLNSTGVDRYSERYCGAHVTWADDDARVDPTRDVVYGPVKLE